MECILDRFLVQLPKPRAHWAFAVSGGTAITVFGAPIFSCPELTELDVASDFLRPDGAFITRLLSHAQGSNRSALCPRTTPRLPEVTLDGLLPPRHICPDLDPSYGDVGDLELRKLDVGESPMCFADEAVVFFSTHCMHPAFELVAVEAHEGDSAPEHVHARESHGAMRK
ncbi:hypothetical protein LXA43DRAFT_1105308 [Ganoderma leucocontextum]|nr:hypothetical protein LXA43DRAFT_1105308 [Ganoderma leucocontextum]